MQNKKSLFIKRSYIGYIDSEKGMFITYRDSKLHYFRKFNGYGISINALDVLEKENVEDMIFVIDKIPYYINASKFLTRGIDYTDGTDKQVIMPFDEFVKAEKLLETTEVQLKLQNNHANGET